MKAKALACCEVIGKKTKKRWRDDKNLMSFLDSLRYPSDSPEIHLNYDTNEHISRLEHITWHDGRLVEKNEFTPWSVSQEILSLT